ncbi:hypothetical protein ACKI10_22025 [Streptomyces galilaeus]|uniref:HNH endonuclease n=1 Tax=Streptomyces galilaeus TaxID=33899 RepID=A0ABW9IDN2_STRGJ
MGIGYEDESPEIDRRFDTLWVRYAATPGVGQPDLRSMHPLRQRQAMTHLLCQVCRKSTFGRRDERHLFLMRSRADEPIIEGEVTAVPPVHARCAQRAITECPHLRKGWTAALVEHMPTWGVAGIVYDRRTLDPLPGPGPGGGGLERVSLFDSETLRWVVAARLLVSLRGVEEIDVRHLANVADGQPVR